MKIDTDAQADLSTPLTASTDSGPKLSPVDVVRAFGVTYGPSVLLDLFVGASTAMLIGERLGWRTSCPLMRTLRPVARLGAAVTAAYLLAIRPRLRRWGATDDETQQTLPGDELVPDPAIDATWAVTIDAPIHEVWGWLAQVGQDRGGFYSYEWLENLAGCQMRNADRIHPEWQQREVGEIVKLHPAYGLKVAHFELDRALVLDGWGAFVVEPIDRQTTRLISRSRVPRGWTALVYALLLEIPHFVMQRKMLLGIKQRAEHAPRAKQASQHRPGTTPSRSMRDDSASGAPPRAPWRSGAIVGVKLVHSAIFLLNSAAILHIFVAGIRDRPSRWTGAALVVAFAANRGRCPLTDLVENLGDESGRVSDIFLPRWFADRIPRLCGPPLLVGVLALLWHRRPAAHLHEPRHQQPAPRPSVGRMVPDGSV